MRLQEKDLCIIVSHYNARPSHELIKLLWQLVLQIAQLRGELSVDVVVVVNMEEAKRLRLPSGLETVKIQYRENSGFNIGSWEHGWRSNPNYYGYLFLQDECVVSNLNAVLNYWLLLNRHPNSLLGESLFFFRGWKGFIGRWPNCHASITDRAERLGIPLGLTASHLQTIALAATHDTLQRLDGFILSDDKIEAIAGEVLLSRKAVSLGLGVKQSAWRPFSNFTHDQWIDIKHRSRSFSWNLSKFFWYLLYGRRDLSVRLTP